MAYIDKTYVTRDQWKLARNFWENTLEQQRKELPRAIVIYDEPTFDDSPLWSTSYVQDLWLKKNCPLNFIQDRLKFQYGDDDDFNILADGITFEFPDISIVQINATASTIYFYDDEVLYDRDDELLIYGSTYFLKIIDSVIEVCLGRETFPGSFIINFFGLDLTYSCASGCFHAYGSIDNEKKITDLGIFNDSYFNLPKFKFSLDSNDFEKYDFNKIYISGDNDVCSLTDYVGFKDSNGSWIRTGRFGLPNYIQRFIK